MTLRVRTGISLRREDTIHFGTALRLGHGRIGLTTDGCYRVGDFLEFQLDLDGWELTVAGIAEVRKAELRQPELHRYLLRILEMKRSERALLQEWCQERGLQAADGAPSSVPALDSGVGSCVPPQACRAMPRASVRGRGDPGESWSRQPPLSISRSVEHQGSRRQALRAVLRAAFADPLGAPEREPPDRPLDPVARVRLEEPAPLVELHYRSLEAWRRDWNTWLHQGLAFTPYRGPAPRIDQQLALRLLLPEHVDLRCPAKVVLCHTTGFGLLLDLDPLQHDSLEVVLTEPDPSQLGSAARVLAKAQRIASTPVDRKLWLRLFGLDQPEDPLELALAELPDPLERLELASAKAQRRLRGLLATDQDDYLAICDRVGEFLDSNEWRWPELQDRVAHHPDPVGQAAAFVVLSHVSRQEAIRTLRAAAAAPEPTMVTVKHAPGGACAQCRGRRGRPTTPARLTRQGLPPYHLGCECRVVPLPHSSAPGAA
jgi:hypothetical protein